MNYNNSLDSIKELLTAAINKNQVTFAQAAKVAETVSSGLLKLKLNESGKTVDFEFMNKKISIDLNRLRINGVKYLNDLLVDDIMTKVDLAQFEELIKQIREEINKKADKEHTHTYETEWKYDEENHYHQANCGHTDARASEAMHTWSLDTLSAQTCGPDVKALYTCTVCGWTYDEEEGLPEEGFAPGTLWEELPEDFVCPLCGVDKEQFEEA